MIPVGVSGRNRGLRPGDHLAFFGSLGDSAWYKMAGLDLGSSEDSPKAILFTKKQGADPMTVVLRVAPDSPVEDAPPTEYAPPTDYGAPVRPNKKYVLSTIMEEAEGTDDSSLSSGSMDRKGIPIFNPTKQAWERVVPRPPYHPSKSRFAHIQGASPDKSDEYIELADWSIESNKEDTQLNPPVGASKDSYQLPAGFRYMQSAIKPSDSQMEETLQSSDLQNDLYQSAEGTSGILGESDVTERLFPGSSRGDASPDTSYSQLGLNSGFPYYEDSKILDFGTGITTAPDSGTVINTGNNYETSSPRQNKYVTTTRRRNPSYYKRQARDVAEWEAANPGRPFPHPIRLPPKRT
ncbi:hypothetical protein TWF281_004896 [Arthrobotrys megalospora]